MPSEKTGTAQSSTPFHEGGPPAGAFAVPDGWNVNLHFEAGDEARCYVFDAEQAERLIESVQRALPAARLARSTTNEIR